MKLFTRVNSILNIFSVFSSCFFLLNINILHLSLQPGSQWLANIQIHKLRDDVVQGLLAAVRTPSNDFSYREVGNNAAGISTLSLQLPFDKSVTKRTLHCSADTSPPCLCYLNPQVFGHLSTFIIYLDMLYIQTCNCLGQLLHRIIHVAHTDSRQIL